MKFWGWVLLIVGLLGCGKQQDVIPYVPVNITIQRGDPRYNNIKVPASTLTYPGGVAGIILYNSGGNILAFDRCSSYQPEKLCAVVPDEGLPTATDPCSGSKFTLTDGLPAKAPATRGLRAYTVIVTDTEIRITN